ncbi:HAD-IA family hydrolase [Sphingomonas sp. ERG5]|uniref:HAD-IA family hydrolase n=1 Tax=Sphingomonas sp. ERG5 TaxID=1381597 RepID=UPI001F37C84E|nr:HAD-IA family hydrolase [Sphingomonas sp. ERG5]
MLNRMTPKPMIPDRAFTACLFDMDGTILSSLAAAERVWSSWAIRHGIDVAEFLPTIHGVRAIETIRRQAIPGMDPEAEAEAITLAEMDDLDGIAAIAGVAAFLGSIGRWAIVTSAPRQLALRRIAAAGLPVPPVLVTANDVANGKPAPDCFLLAANKLGVDARDCLVFEDAPAGIAAAEAAGATVVVVTATHDHAVETSHHSIADYTQLVARAASDGRFTIGLG